MRGPRITICLTPAQYELLCLAAEEASTSENVVSPAELARRKVLRGLGLRGAAADVPMGPPRRKGTKPPRRKDKS